MIHRTRRPLILALVIAGLLGAMATPAAAADPTTRLGGKPLPHRGPDRGTAAVLNVPAGVLGLKSYLGWVYEDASIAIVGEVLNNTTTRRTAIGVRVTYYASTTSTVSLGTHSDTVVIDGVSRGGVGPFVVYDPTPPDGVGAFLVEISTSGTTTTAPAGGLDLAVGTPTVSSGIRTYAGTVHNPNKFAVNGVVVALTAYDLGGSVGEVMTPTAVLGPIPAGGTAPFSIDIDADFGTNFTMASVRFLADGYRDGTAATPVNYVTSWANYFDDLLGNTFRYAIVWLAEQDITRGCGPGRYCPDDDVTRGQMAAFLDRALDLPETSRDFFTDDETSTFEGAINRLAASGITKGCSATTFCPTGKVTRGQMAAFLDRALALAPTATDFFTDDETSTFEGAINRLAASGITKGCTATTFCPKANVSRGQMAAFLQRALSD